MGACKLLDLMQRRDPKRKLPSISTAARIIAKESLIKPKRRNRRAHPGSTNCVPQVSNDICLHLCRRHRWAADYKGQFLLKNGEYCFLLTVSDLSYRFVLGVDAYLDLVWEDPDFA